MVTKGKGEREKEKGGKEGGRERDRNVLNANGQLMSAFEY